MRDLFFEIWSYIYGVGLLQKEIYCRRSGSYTRRLHLDAWCFILPRPSSLARIVGVRSGQCVVVQRGSRIGPPAWGAVRERPGRLGKEAGLPTRHTCTRAARRSSLWRRAARPGGVRACGAPGGRGTSGAATCSCRCTHGQGQGGGLFKRRFAILPCSRVLFPARGWASFRMV